MADSPLPVIRSPTLPKPCRPVAHRRPAGSLYRAQSEPTAQRGNYFCGSTTVFVDPSGAACMPGGLCPCGLSGGAPPDLVSSGPVQPCGCNWPFSSGGERPVVVFTSVFDSACAAANPHENIRQMAVIIIRIASSAWLTGGNRQGALRSMLRGRDCPHPARLRHQLVEQLPAEEQPSKQK